MLVVYLTLIPICTMTIFSVFTGSKCQAERGVYGGKNKFSVVSLAQHCCTRLLLGSDDPGCWTAASGSLESLTNCCMSIRS